MGAVDRWARAARHVKDLKVGSMGLKVWLALMITGAAWLASGQVLAQTKVVAVLASEGPGSTESLREGVREALKGAGWVEGRNLKLVSETASAEGQALSQRALSLVQSRPDVLVALSVTAAQALRAHTKQIPIVFAGVTDPVQAELVPSWSPSNTNVTGVSDVLPLARRVALIRQLVPQARRVGVVYTPADSASVAVIKEFQEQVTKAGLLMVEVTAVRAIDAAAAARSLLGKVDVLHTFWDANTQTVYPGLVKVANDAKVPLLGVDTASVLAGAVAALVMTDREVGAAAGRQVVRILRGTKPGSIAPEQLSRPQLQLNLAAAQKQGVVLSETLLKTGSVIVK